jgi:hypothetical protein
MIYEANKVHGKQRKGSETRALKELAMCRLFQKEPVPEKFDMVFGCKLERQFCWTVLAGLIPHHSSSFLMAVWRIKAKVFIRLCAKFCVSWSERALYHKAGSQ